jgi:hypothetical protein
MLAGCAYKATHLGEYLRIFQLLKNAKSWPMLLENMTLALSIHSGSPSSPLLERDLHLRKAPLSLMHSLSPLDLQGIQGPFLPFWLLCQFMEKSGWFFPELALLLIRPNRRILAGVNPGSKECLALGIAIPFFLLGYLSL